MSSESERRADEASEQDWLWSRALEGSRQVAWDFDVPNGMVRVSPQWRELLDLDEDDRYHHISKWLGRMHPDDRAPMAAATERVRVDGDTEFDATYRLRHTAGHWIWVLSRGRMVEAGPDGLPTRMIGTITDITRQKELEQELKVLTERYAVALEASRIGIWERDYLSGTRNWDVQTMALHGITGDTVDQASDWFLQLVHEDDRERMRQVLSPGAAPGPTHVDIDYRVRVPGSGEVRHLRGSVYLLSDEVARPVRAIGACWDITADVERSAQERETMGLLHALLEGTPDLVYVKDGAGNYLLASPSVQRLMGRAADQIIGRHDRELFPPETAEPVIEHDREVMATGAVQTSIERVTVDGVVRTWSSTKAPRIDASGNIAGVVGISHDITDVIAAQEALRRSELRWEFAIEGSGDGIWDWDMVSDTVFYSRRWKAMLGYAEHEIGTSVEEWSGRIHPDDAARCRAAIDRHLRGDTPDFHFEHRMLAKDGGWRWIYDRGKVIERDADGAGLRMIGTHTDITLRKESEQAILAANERTLEEKERLRITLHSIGDAVITTDAQQHVTFMNPVAEGMTGWSAAEAMGLPLGDVFHVVDELTGASVANPVETCLADLRAYHLSDGVELVRRDGARRAIRDSAAPVRAPSGEVIGAVLVFQDVTQARAVQLALEHSASHDGLTGLSNRVAFERRLRDACQQAHLADRKHLLCFIDLDRFKVVNDSAGHAAGDAVLRDVASLIRRCCRRNDVAARLGGDEFGLLLYDCDEADGQMLVRRFLRELADLRFDWDGHSYRVGASVGMARIVDGPVRPQDVMAQADIACYAAKTAGRNQLAIYDGERGAALRNHRDVHIAADIRSAIETDRFRLFAQEMVDLRAPGSEIRHVEILLRMLDEGGALISPAQFIPASEHYDLMTHVDQWVLRTALRAYGARIARHDLAIAVNLSAHSLNDPYLWPFLRAELDDSVLLASRLHVEIAETSIVSNLTGAVQLLTKVRAAGCGVVLDDFGAGVSSFSYLRQFPFSGLKIDGGLVARAADSEIDRVIVESINTVAHRLGAQTTAEHVEDERTLQLVRDLGIDRAQGFAVARPIPLDEFLEHLEG